MIASSNFPQEPRHTITPDDGIAEDLNSHVQPIPRTSINRKPSLYSFITGRNDSLFSNSSQQTVTVSTSLQSSTTSFSNQLDHHTSRFRILKKAKSSLNMSGSVSPSGPSDLSRVQSTTAIPQSGGRSRTRAQKGGDIELQGLDCPSNPCPTRVENPVSVRVVGRGGQGSRPRLANQRISYLHHSLREPISPSSPADSSVNVLSTHPKTSAVPGPISIARVVGRGGLGSKRRIHLNPSSTLISSSDSSDSRVYPHERTQSSSTHSQSYIEASSSLSTTTIRVNGRGGAGSRLRIRPPSPSSERSLLKMCKFKWKGRKRSKSDVGALSEKLTSPGINYPKFSALKRAKSQKLSISNDDDQSGTLPTIPASPPTPTANLELDPNPTSPSLPVYTHPSDVLLPAAPRSKVERTMGHAVPAHMLLSANDMTDYGPIGRRNRRRSRGSTHSLSSLSSTTRSNRRGSLARSLSSLGSFIRLSNSRPSSDVYIYAEEDTNDVDAGVMEDDDKEEVCWIDNEYDSYSREGAITPISPMIFSVRPPSPTPPKLKLVIDSVGLAETSASVVSVSSEAEGHEHSELDSVDGGDEDEDENNEARSELPTPATTPNDSTVSDTPLSLSCNAVCDAVPPASPIVFSECPPFSPRSDSVELETSENTPRAELKTFLSEPMTLPPSIAPVTPPVSPFQSSFLFPVPHRREGREEREMRPQGWTGEWNRKDVREVIRSLRELK
ncbi:hypothetical protein F5890DRAFT_1510868 [Lentinula detonsa]|uniref:Uncharacterized protein n=1 Tax=Lentinula detonsa TaxID=2804962 RepID=A0AA38USN1_9AGAR|nr:hypothetical protein F5890DRAFT_1510868 [Lentinula detonsa]